MSKWYTVEGLHYDQAGGARGRAKFLANNEGREVKVLDDRGQTIAIYRGGGDVENITPGGNDGATSEPT